MPPVVRAEPAPAATAGSPESAREERALDLSLPPQPKVELGSFEVLPSTPSRLLPDLFGPERTQGGSALSLKGRLFTNEAEREDLDAIEGGEITVEVKTR